MRADYTLTDDGGHDLAHGTVRSVANFNQLEQGYASLADR